jgi:hypothetical protein
MPQVVRQSETSLAAGRNRGQLGPCWNDVRFGAGTGGEDHRGPKEMNLSSPAPLLSVHLIVAAATACWTASPMIPMYEDAQLAAKRCGRHWN